MIALTPEMKVKHVFISCVPAAVDISFRAHFENISFTRQCKINKARVAKSVPACWISDEHQI